MKVCMLVYNNVTRDNRVIREAETLQAAGHELHIVGIPDNNVTAKQEVLPSGVVIHRVDWGTDARRKAILTTPLRALPLAIVLGLIVWGAWVGVAHLMPTLRAMNLHDWIGTIGVLVALIVAIGIVVHALVARNEAEFCRRDKIMRHADALIRDGKLDPKDYPKPKTLIPPWIPDYVLETLLEPFNLVSVRANRFTLWRYRSQAMADFAVSLKPEVVHTHDCAALPSGVLVKKTLNIPLVYDAHEIYEAAASRQFGITDYFTRLHRLYVGEVDRFITINKNIALFYRLAYPQLPPAILIRNATRRSSGVAYDGRLHAAAGLPRAQKILLYQGGYTKARGLPLLVKAAAHLPDDWTLVMMGWGPLDADLRAIASASPSKVVFIPAAPRADLALWTAGGTVGIVPYENTVLNHWFCSPNKLWEYPVAGVPLFVQPYPELRAIVETYGCGWLLPEDMSPQAVAAIVGGLSDEALAKAQAGCRAFIDADNWDVVYGPRLIELYAGLGARKISTHSYAAMAAQ